VPRSGTNLAQQKPELTQELLALCVALAKELTPADTLTIDAIVAKSGPEKFKLKSVIREVILSDRFLGQNLDWCLDQD
jgi:hypothetical protein